MPKRSRKSAQVTQEEESIQVRQLKNLRKWNGSYRWAVYLNGRIVGQVRKLQDGWAFGAVSSWAHDLDPFLKEIRASNFAVLKDKVHAIFSGFEVTFGDLVFRRQSVGAWRLRVFVPFQSSHPNANGRFEEFLLQCYGHSHWKLRVPLQVLELLHWPHISLWDGGNTYGLYRDYGTDLKKAMKKISREYEEGASLRAADRVLDV